MTTIGETPSLGSLIEKTQNLLANFEIPIRTRSLPEILPITKHMAEEHDVNFDVDALMFFAKRGLDVTKQQELLQSLSTQQTQATESIEAVIDWDVDRWMETQQSQLISAAIEECDVYNNISFQDYFITSLDDDWVNLKRELLESMDIELPKTSISTSSMQDTVVSSPEGADSAITPEQELYGKAIEQYNYTHRQNSELNNVGNTPALTKYLLEASKQYDNSVMTNTSFDIVELWSVLDSISTALSSTDVVLRNQQILYGSCTFLHNVYIQHVIDTLVAEGSLSEDEGHLLYNNGNIHMSADSYVRLSALYVRSSQFYNRIQSVSSNGYQLPNTIWAQAYTCLRMGDAMACRSILGKSSEECSALLISLNTYQPGMSNSTPLSGNIVDSLRIEFNNQPLESTDPFRAAMYHLIGHLSDETQILKSRIATFTRSAFEDFIWQKLLLVELSGTNKSQEDVIATALSEQTNALVRNLQANNASILQIVRIYQLSQQFERAVYILYYDESLPNSKMLAIHLAAALTECKLARVDNDSDNLFELKQDKTVLSLNMSRLLFFNIRMFKGVPKHSTLALHYIYTLSLLTTDKHHVMSELASLLNKGPTVLHILLQAKDLSRWTKMDAYQQSPLVQLFGMDVCYNQCQQVAGSYLERGMLETAVSLYYLSTEYLVMGIVLLTLLCKAISEQDADRVVRVTDMSRQYYGLFHQSMDVPASSNLSNHDIYALSGTRDARLNDIQFVCSCIRVTVSIGEIMTKRQQIHLSNKNSTNTSLHKLLIDITALRLLPTSFNHVEWNSVHHTIEQLPECIQSLMSLLVLEYYNTLSDYSKAVKREQQEATRVDNTKSLQECKNTLETIKEQSAVLYQFMMNRFSVVSPNVCAIIAIPLV